MAEQNNEWDFPSISTSEIEESQQDLYFANGGSPTTTTDDVTDIKEEVAPSFGSGFTKNTEQYFPDVEGEYFDDDLEDLESGTTTSPSKDKQSKKATPRKSVETVTEEAAEPTDEIPTDESPESEDTPQDPSQVDFQAIAQEFFDLGLLTTDEGEEESAITTQEELIERFQYEKEKAGIKYVYENIISKHGEEGMRMFHEIFINGVPPQEFFAIVGKTQSIKDMDLTNEQNQRFIYGERLRMQGYSEAQIERHIRRSFELGELEEDAREAHAFLVEQQEKEEEARLAHIAAIEQQKAQLKQIYVENVRTELATAVKRRELGNLPITDKMARELEEYLTKEAYQLKTTGERLTQFDVDILSLREPQNHSKKVALAYLWKMYEKDPTLSSIKKKGVSEAANPIFNSLVRKEKVVNKTKPAPFGASLIK